MKRVLINVVLLAWLAGATAWASNIYSVNYEGSDLPESEAGWHRAYGGGGAIRSIETDPDDPNNRFLLINSLASPEIFDYAYYSRQMSPTRPGERFYGTWRALVVENDGSLPDQGITYAADNGNIVSLAMGYDYVRDEYDGWRADIAPGVFHAYRLESPDMVNYSLWIDGQFVREAPFFEGLLSSFADFGDEGYGGAVRSLVQWDYMRFGVYQVPEPGSLAMAVIMGVCGVRRRR